MCIVLGPRHTNKERIETETDTKIRVPPRQSKYTTAKYIINFTNLFIIGKHDLSNFIVGIYLFKVLAMSSRTKAEQLF